MLGGGVEGIAGQGPAVLTQRRTWAVRVRLRSETQVVECQLPGLGGSAGDSPALPTSARRDA